METTYANVNLTDIFAADARSEPSPAPSPEKLLTDDELEDVVDRILDDDAANVTPPDRLISLACRWLTGTVDQFREVADKIPSDVVRAKGFVFENGKPYLYSHVGNAYEVSPFQGPPLENRVMNRVVFIRREFQEDDIRQIFADQGITLV